MADPPPEANQPDRDPQGVRHHQHRRADCPTWPDVADEVIRVLGDRVLVAHHASVEYTVLRTHLPDWQPPLALDTLRLARHVWPHLGSYSLDALPVSDRQASGQRHRAAHDTMLTYQLLQMLVESGNLNWDQLVDAAALPGLTEVRDPHERLW